MPTTRFLPGDRVQVKPRSAAVLGLATNATHTIAHVDDFGQIAIRGGSSYYHPSHFELRKLAGIGDYGVPRVTHTGHLPAPKTWEGDYA